MPNNNISITFVLSFRYKYGVSEGANMAEKLTLERQNKERNNSFLSIMKILEAADTKNSSNSN